ncbi:MAG: SDR family NAD(P)-dependent oxidoreductase [Candidatus Latescibacterota bacterium]
MGKLEGKTAIITGGGTGIGRAIARTFHEEGAFVVVCGRRREKLDETCNLLSCNGERVLAVTADVTNEDDIKRLFGATVAKTGRIDILVNNAGVMRFGKLHETPAEQWDMMMRINAFGPWRLMVQALPWMKKNGGGSIINLSSIAGIKAFPGVGVYCASKAALQTISQVMAMEAAPERIRVNCILPALVEDTELSEPIFGAENVPAFWDRMRTLHPLGRNGKPADIAGAALFFASDESEWITGTLLNVDGGRHLASNRPAE